MSGAASGEHPIRRERFLAEEGRAPPCGRVLWLECSPEEFVYDQADVLGRLRTNGIECGERAAGITAERGGGWGGLREVLVREDDLAIAHDLIVDHE